MISLLTSKKLIFPVLVFTGGLAAGAFLSAHLSRLQSSVIATVLATQSENFGKAAAANASLAAQLDEYSRQEEENAAAYAKHVMALDAAAKERERDRQLLINRLNQDLERLKNGNEHCQNWLNSPLPVCAIDFMRSAGEGSGSDLQD